MSLKNLKSVLLQELKKRFYFWWILLLFQPGLWVERFGSLSFFHPLFLFVFISATTLLWLCLSLLFKLSLSFFLVSLCMSIRYTLQVIIFYIKNLFYSTKFTFLLWHSCRAISSDTRGLRFESSHQQLNCC